MNLINDLSAKTSDTIVSYGERLSSMIVSNVIKDAKLFDSRKYIKTVKQINKHIVDFDLTNKLIKETFSPLPKVSLVPGFISSSTETGEVTNLGRGGSDYTASILATALDANTLDLFGRGWFHDRRSPCDQLRLRNRPAYFHGGDGVV